MKLQLSPDVLSAKLAGETVLLDMKSKNYFQLNATAARIWDALERGLTVGEAVGELCDAFDAPAEQVDAEARKLVAALSERGLLRAGVA